MARISKLIFFTCLVTGLLRVFPTSAQFSSDKINLSESKVLSYTLPDPLVMANGDTVKTALEWQKKQRPYIYHLFEKNVYGLYPRGVPVLYQVRELDRHALSGKATRKQVRLFLKPGDTTVFIDVLLYLPHDHKGPAPVFLGLNFNGNATVINDPSIFLSKRLVSHGYKIPNTDSARGTKSSRWPVEMIIDHGIGVVTACYSDLEEDRPGGWKTGIRGTLAGVLHEKPDQWGAIGAWAWGLSRIMDYLEKDTDVNGNEVAVIGLSRLGKAALWAGVSDTRFSVVISNESGEGGAALARRWFGETVRKINTSFPYWFVNQYKKYNYAVDSLPVDQHELLALIAPRPLYVASAQGDQWSDPKGEFLSAVHAAPVYALFGKKGLGTRVMPGVNHPIGNTIAYHIRTGTHDIVRYDWSQYINFVKRQWNIR